MGKRSRARSGLIERIELLGLLGLRIEKVRDLVGTFLLLVGLGGEDLTFGFWEKFEFWDILAASVFDFSDFFSKKRRMNSSKSLFWELTIKDVGNRKI